jgi:hypothetical protein
MAYSYETQRANIFTEEGQRLFLAIRDRADSLLKQAGAARLQEVISGNSGDSWDMLACVDRLVELGELREISQERCAGQYRVFVRGRNGDEG